MKMRIIPAAHELISNMRTIFETNNSKRSYINEEPLRTELFNSEQMERLGSSLAETHKLSKEAGGDHLLKRMADNERVLHETHKLISDLIKKDYQIPPAGEWLIDNFYLIEDHVRSAKFQFPKEYSKDLPLLDYGHSSGELRIYDIVLHVISHSDGRIDIESLSSFLKAYQAVANLKLGELWAIPIMLRLALIENMRRVSARVAIDMVNVKLANYWAGKMLEAVEKDPKDLLLVMADMARSDPPRVSAFVSELTRQLKGKGPELASPLRWMEQQLAESGKTSAEFVNDENQKQATDQISMKNSVGSLRLLASIDWRIFVETNSIVEQILCEDNEQVYGSMDFSTRDRYRHVVEQIAKKVRYLKRKLHG